MTPFDARESAHAREAPVAEPQAVARPRLEIIDKLRGLASALGRFARNDVDWQASFAER